MSVQGSKMSEWVKFVLKLEIHIGVLTHYTSGVRNGRLCQELPGTLTLIGLVGRCVPVPIYYFGLAKISIE